MKSDQHKLLRIVVAVLTVLSITISIFCWLYYQSRIFVLVENGSKSSKEIYRELSQTLTADALSRLNISNPSASKTYRVLSELLENARSLSHAAYLEVVRFDEQTSRWIYILDGHPNSNDVGIFYGEPVDSPYLDSINEVAKTGLAQTGIIEQSEYGHLTTNYFPLLDVKGRTYAVMSIDYAIGDQVGSLKKFLSYFQAFGVASLLGTLAHLFLGWQSRSLSVANAVTFVTPKKR